MKKLQNRLKATNNSFKLQLNEIDKNGHNEKFTDDVKKSNDETDEADYGALLHKLGFILASATSIEKTLEQVLEYVLKVKEIAAAGIYFFNMETGEIEFSSSSGLSKQFTEQAKKQRGFQSFMYRRILRKGAPSYTKFSKIPLGSKIFGQENLQEIGVIPIKYAGKVIGSFNIGSASPWDLRKDTKIFLEAIAAQIGGTLWRISSQQALQLNQKNFQLVFETIDDFIFILDSQGRIIKTNQVVEKRLGYTSEELKGMPVMNLHPSEKREEAAFIINEILAGRLTFCPIPLLAKTGKEIPVETRAQRGEWDGKEVLYGISRDISERKKLEHSLVTALQKEKEVNELKSQLMTMASHEFRTPLATMLMASEMLDAHWDKMPKENIQENIERIKNNILFLKDTIEKTLNLSRLESGDLKFDPVQTDLNNFLKSCIDDIKKSETRHKINYLGIKLPLQTEIDRQMIKEVVVQLLSNSIKFSHPGTPIQVKLKENKNDIKIRFSDKGVGIPEAEKEYIFDSFRRCSNIFNVRGTGIGLALSKKFILLHGGNITVKSQLNEGTTFIVTLPKSQKRRDGK